MNQLARCSLIVSLLVGCSDGVSSDPVDPDAPGADAPVTPDAPVVAGNKRVFVTDRVYQGGLVGGLAGADAKCTERAAAAGLAGTYKAWLSDATTSAATRLTQSTNAYMLVDGTVVASSFAALASGTLAHAIDRDPFGVAYTAPIKCSIVGGAMIVWTATQFDGTKITENLFCGNWQQLSANGLVGDMRAVNSKWTATNCAQSCTDEAALYCVEQ